MREHQTPNYVTDLREYFDEVDAAWGRITDRDGHDHVVATAHSTGGLTLPLWADEGAGRTWRAWSLNSPWLDMRGSILLRTAGTAVVRRLGGRQPMREIPREVTGSTARACTATTTASGTSTSSWKTLESWPVYAGWLRAIRNAPRRAAPRPRHRLPRAGADPPARPSTPEEMSDDVHAQRHRARRRADPPLVHRRSDGTSRTSAIEGATPRRLPVARPGARPRYDELGRWLAAYVDADLAVTPPDNPVVTRPPG